MSLSVPRYLWLLLCYAQFTKPDVFSRYAVSSEYINSKSNWMIDLPTVLGVDKHSGCICRATASRKLIVCFGGYDCKKFPKVSTKSEVLRVRTSIIDKIKVGELDYLYYLNTLEIDANHGLKIIQPGSFRNLSKLEELSISYSPALQTIDERTFDGLLHLRNLSMVNNGFTSILSVASALHPTILPSLQSVDLSENVFEVIPRESFQAMEGTRLKKLKINLCQNDFIHSSAFLPLKMLKELSIAENELNSTLIADFLMTMMDEGISLAYLDLSGIGFRRHPPRKLMKVIAKSTIRTLLLAKNQFETLVGSSFPVMKNIEILDLSKVSAVVIEPNTFDPLLFPNLKALYLGGNNLPGLHEGHVSTQLQLLDLSYNTLTSPNPMYYEIDKDTFINSTQLRILNLSFNRIKSIFNYTFRGLRELRLLNMENGTIFHIGNGTFITTPRLEILNLANNPLTASENFTKSQWEGLNELKILILRNCGIKYFDEEDIIFENMPNIVHLILKNNKLYFITAKILNPLKALRVLDLSENFLVAWGAPLFFKSDVRPHNVFLTNNKISHFSTSMLQDFNYLIGQNRSTEIDLMGNIFMCDCSAMHDTYTWIEANASYYLKQYFTKSKFLCSTPDLWEDKRVFDYLLSIKSLPCNIYNNVSTAMVVVQTTPSIIIILLTCVALAMAVKYRVYIKYWIFLAKLALGRRFIRKPLNAHTKIEAKYYKYDAFISYSNEDREFVTDMITELEATPPYLKLCVYERDFEIGSFISESILNSISESKYIILVITNGFAKSQWCRWETQLAEYHRLFLEDGTVYDPLVLVRIGDIEPKYITTTLKYLLKTKIYLSWNEDHPEDFWKKLRNVLQKQKG